MPEIPILLAIVGIVLVGIVGAIRMGLKHSKSETADKFIGKESEFIEKMKTFKSSGRFLASIVVYIFLAILAFIQFSDFFGNSILIFAIANIPVLWIMYSIYCIVYNQEIINNKLESLNVTKDESEYEDDDSDES